MRRAWSNDILKKNHQQERGKPLIIVSFDGSGTTFDPLYIKEYLFPAFIQTLEKLSGKELEGYQTFDPEKIFNTSFNRRAEKEFDALNKIHNFDFDFRSSWDAAKQPFREILKDPKKANKVGPIDVEAIQSAFKTVRKYSDSATIVTAIISNLSPSGKNGNISPLDAQVGQFLEQHDFKPSVLDFVIGAENDNQRKPNIHMAQKLYDAMGLQGHQFTHIHLGDGFSDMQFAANLVQARKNIRFVLNNEESIQEYSLSITNSNNPDEIAGLSMQRRNDWVEAAHTLKDKLQISSSPQDMPSVLDKTLSRAIREQERGTNLIS